MFEGKVNCRKLEAGGGLWVVREGVWSHVWTKGSGERTREPHRLREGNWPYAVSWDKARVDFSRCGFTKRNSVSSWAVV